MLIILSYLFSVVSNSNFSCNCEVFLSLKEKNKIVIYSTTTKKKIVNKVGHNFNKEDYLSIKILEANDSMYYVLATHSVSGSRTKGWITRKTKLAIYSRAYDKELFLYKKPYKGEVAAKIAPTIKELEVLSCKDDWVKIKVHDGRRSRIGWIPPESQCSNPYTTCN